MCDFLAGYVAVDRETLRESFIPFDPHKLTAKEVGEMVLGIGLSPGRVISVEGGWDMFSPDRDNFYGGWLIPQDTP